MVPGFGERRGFGGWEGDGDGKLHVTAQLLHHVRGQRTPHHPHWLRRDAAPPRRRIQLYGRLPLHPTWTVLTYVAVFLFTWRFLISLAVCLFVLHGQF